MEKKKYTIGFFTADYNRGLVSVVLDSLTKYIEKYDNLSVRVFDYFGISNEKKSPSPANEIYDLPDLNDFDGVIVQSHQIINQSALTRLGKKIREHGLPAVSIGDFMDGCTRINTDDYSAFRSMTKHLIEDHGAQTFLFLKGMERTGTGEAESRRKGFEDECRAHGIDSDNISYAEGTWLGKDGRRAAKELLKKGRPFPDAIVSANDEMALGAMSTLQEAGVRVPEDIIMTGYDDVFDASLSNPRLTTVRRDFRTIVFTAMDVLRKKVRFHEELPELIYSPYQMIFAGSCGCHWNKDSELSSLKSDFYRHNRELTLFYTRQDRMTSELYFAEEPTSLLRAIEKNASIFGGGHIYICANDFYHNSLFRGSDEIIFGSEHVQHYSDSFFLTAASAPGDLTCDDEHIYHRFKRSELMQVPFFKKQRFLLFYPLHFNNLLMGFFVMTEPPTSLSLSIHEVVLHLFEFAIENIRQKLISRNLNTQLDILYITDQLTGLYNRFGYERLSDSLFYHIRTEGLLAHVLFIDIDNMKSINDIYGHDKGDLAITAVADAIKAACHHDDFKMRYGGDEFVVITEKTDKDLRELIKAHIREINLSNRLPFELEVSIGEYIGSSEADYTPDDYLKLADKQMYLEKKEKRKL